jgi:hypothetical protein
MSSKFFLKDEVGILRELGSAVLDMSIEELIAKYQEHDLEFGRFWREDLVEKTKDMTQEERALYVDIAYDTYDSIRAILYKKPVLTPQVKPESRFKRDLGFNHDDFVRLRGLFKDEYIPFAGKRRWKFWSQGDFFELKTVADCVEYVYKNRIPTHVEHVE